jgi:hypothetical protein
MPPMSIFKDFLTEDELLDEFKKKKIRIGNKRTLRGWRQQRVGPIVYPTDAFEAWLRAGVQQPVRSRRAA